MPETDAPKKENPSTDSKSGDALERLLADVQGAGRPAGNADDARRNLLNDAQRPFIQAAGECYRCHPKRDNGAGFKLSLAGFDSFDKLYKKNPETPAEKEKRIEREFQSMPVEQKLITVFSRLPEKAAVELGKDSLSIKTDFAKAVEAVPGAQLDDASRKTLSALQSLSLDKDSFTARFSGEHRIPVNREIPVIGELKDIKVSDANGQLKFDLKLDGKSAVMDNINGLKLVMADGREIAIHRLGLRSGEKGSNVELTIDNPGKKPDWMNERLWPKTVPVSLPAEMVFPQSNPEMLNSVVKACAEAKNVLKERNFSPYLSGITEEGLKGTIDKVMSGVSKIQKNGDRLELTRNNGEIQHDLAGATLKVGETVSFRLGADPKAPSVLDITGVKVAIPLPSELRIGDGLESVKSVSLGHCDYSGARDLQIKMGPLVDNIRLNLNKNMQPATDADGNWKVGLRVANLLSNSPGDKVSMQLRIGADGKLNMKPSEILDIVSDATGQAADFSFKGAVKAGISVESKIISTAAWLFGY